MSGQWVLYKVMELGPDDPLTPLLATGNRVYELGEANALAGIQETRITFK
jgi:hypothetical protein